MLTARGQRGALIRLSGDGHGVAVGDAAADGVGVGDAEGVAMAEGVDVGVGDVAASGWLLPQAAHRTKTPRMPGTFSCFPACARW